MKLSKNAYRKYADARAPRSPIFKNCIFAFLIGGLICTLGQGLRDIYTRLCGMTAEDAGILTAVSLIFLAALLTGLGIFDRVAKVAGAGTLVPITGFANAMTSTAVDAKSEGWILGVGSKIFSVAGPVLLYGTLAGAMYGVIYWIASQW